MHSRCSPLTVSSLSRIKVSGLLHSMVHKEILES